MNERSDLPGLTEAFAELERRADTASARTPDSAMPAVPAAHHRRWPLAAASAAAVVVVAGGGAYLAHGTDSGSSSAGVQAGGAPVAAASNAAPAPLPAPASALNEAPAPTPATVPASSPAASATGLPDGPKALSDRFRTILSDTAAFGTATFTVTYTGGAVKMGAPLPQQVSPTGGPTGPTWNGPIGQTVGAAIVGTLSVNGHTGGYDLQWLPNTPGAKARCEDPDRSNCKITRLADGSSLAVGTEPVQNSRTGVTHEVDLIRPDGTEFLMHVSNERDPKGDSKVLSPKPPLTTEQMVKVVTSPLWGGAN